MDVDSKLDSRFDSGSSTKTSSSSYAIPVASVSGSELKLLPNDLIRGRSEQPVRCSINYARESPEKRDEILQWPNTIAWT